MPELPEVETIRRELAPFIKDQRVQDCQVLRPDMVAYPDAKTLCKKLVHDRIGNVERKAKYLIVNLTSGNFLIFHLRLSGTIFMRPRGAAPERYTRIIITLEDYELFFNEPRTLGKLFLIEKGSQRGIPPGLLTLGLEPISPGFSTEYLHTHVRGRRAPIKSLLLDQRICAGVGNIYSDEALFHAGVRPTRRAYRVTRHETERLVSALRNILYKAVEEFGTSVGDYVRTNGTDGSFQDFLYVYQREGLPCRICGTAIKVRKFGNRSTRYCPKCQK
jgi:formamidopyrimidine-DNA glycosylase